MKRLTLAAAAMLCMLSACNNTKTADAASGNGNSMAQKNLDAVHVVNDAFKTGDVSHIDDAVAADMVDHTDGGDKGRDSLKAMIVQMHKATSGAKVDILKEVADDEYVFQMVRYSGTSDGSMMPPGPYEMHGVEVIRCKDAKPVEHWGFINGAEMMKMMGHMPPAAAPMPASKADSSMKKK